MGPVGVAWRRKPKRSVRADTAVNLRNAIADNGTVLERNRPNQRDALELRHVAPLACGDAAGLPLQSVASIGKTRAKT
jgi:hypothetical protein